MLWLKSEILMMKINVRQFNWTNVFLDYAQNTQIILSECNDNYFAAEKKNHVCQTIAIEHRYQ